MCYIPLYQAPSIVITQPPKEKTEETPSAPPNSPELKRIRDGYLPGCVGE